MMAIPENPYADNKRFYISHAVWNDCSAEWAKWALEHTWLKMELSIEDWDALEKMAGGKT